VSDALESIRLHLLMKGCKEYTAEVDAEGRVTVPNGPCQPPCTFSSPGVLLGLLEGCHDRHDIDILLIIHDTVQKIAALTKCAEGS